MNFFFKISEFFSGQFDYLREPYGGSRNSGNFQDDSLRILIILGIPDPIIGIPGFRV